EKLALVDRIRQHSGIKDILLADIGYLKGVSGTGMQIEKDNSDKYMEANVMNVSPNFISFMQIPLLAGRNMESDSDMFVDDVFRDKNG
ncbi:ABC transporter permease, partial [Bacteroides thetaiotaomicron]|nr:ABC transporter permease [Bacteroides thetaiotaomicron]